MACVRVPTVRVITHVCLFPCVGVHYPTQERRADAVLDHTDQHGVRHVLGSSLPGSHRLTEEVQPAAAAGDDVKTLGGTVRPRGGWSWSESSPASCEVHHGTALEICQR